MSQKLYKLLHKKDHGSCAFRDARETHEQALIYDNRALLLNDDTMDGIYTYIYCTEEASESIKPLVSVVMQEQ